MAEQDAKGGKAQALRLEHKAARGDVTAHAERIRRLLGETGEPIAEALRSTATAFEKGTAEMRVYAEGAEASAADAKAEAQKAALSAKKVEDSLSGISVGDVKGVEALQRLAELGSGFGEAVKKEVEDAIVINIAGAGEPEKLVKGSAALQFIAGRVANLHKSTTGALNKANEAVDAVASLKAGLASAFAAVDEKISALVQIVAELGVTFSVEEKAELDRPSFQGDKK